MPERKPPFVEKVEEIVKLLPVLERRVMAARGRGESLDPAILACLQAASVLKTDIIRMEESLELEMEKRGR